VTGPDLRHPVSLRGIDYWLDQMAASLRAHAEQPVEIRDIACSLESKARAIRRDPEYANAPASPWVPLDPDGLPPATYPSWRAQEQRRRRTEPA